MRQPSGEAVSTDYSTNISGQNSILSDTISDSAVARQAEKAAQMVNGTNEPRLSLRLSLNWEEGVRGQRSNLTELFDEGNGLQQPPTPKKRSSLGQLMITDSSSAGSSARNSPRNFGNNESNSARSTPVNFGSVGRQGTDRGLGSSGGQRSRSGSASNILGALMPKLPATMNPDPQNPKTPCR